MTTYGCGCIDWPHCIHNRVEENVMPKSSKDILSKEEMTLGSIRYELEMLLPCINCGVNADPADGFGYCTCGSEQKIDEIICTIEDSQASLLRRAIKELPKKLDTRFGYKSASENNAYNDCLDECKAMLNKMLEECQR